MIALKMTTKCIRKQHVTQKHLHHRCVCSHETNNILYTVLVPYTACIYYSSFCVCITAELSFVRRRSNRRFQLLRCLISSLLFSLYRRDVINRNPSRTQFILNNIYNLSSYFTGNTLRLRYEDQQVNAVYEMIALCCKNIRNIQVHSVGRMRIYSMLKHI
jgi:hypothetical protein